MEILFKAKLSEQAVFEEGKGFSLVKGYKIPRIKRSHCDMSLAGKHPKLGGFSNSDMFETIVNRMVKGRYGSFIPEAKAELLGVRGFLDVVRLSL